MSEGIEEFVGLKKIPFLLHFTRTTNIPSIMANGIMPRDRMQAAGLQADINDELRLDGHLDGISTSIAFPNSKMLWKLRQENPGVNWAILLIFTTVLWEKPCAFCKYNAADIRISSLDINNLKNLTALSSMYDPIAGIDRGADKLKEFDPTDVQAEVLVFEEIPPEYIGAVVFQSSTIKAQYEKFFPDRKIFNHGRRGFFSDRKYHRS